MKRLFPSPFEAVVLLFAVAVAVVALATPSCAEAGHNGVRSFSTVTTYQSQQFNGLGAGGCYNQGGGQSFQSLGVYQAPAAVLLVPQGAAYGQSFQSFGIRSHGVRVNSLGAYGGQSFQSFGVLSGGYGTGSVTTTTTTGQGLLGLRNRQTSRTTTRFGR